MPGICLLLRFFFVLLLLVSVSVTKAFSASADISIAVEKTFDHGTLIDHKITARDANNTVTVIYSQRRRHDGSDQIAKAFLTFRPQRRSDNRPHNNDEVRLLLKKILQTMHGKFGKNMKLVSMTASGFLNICEIQTNNLKAFSDHEPWRAYMKSDPKQYSQYQAHKMVVDRWRETKVYDPIIRIFASTGYTLELSGFEKLFVQRTDQFGCIPQNLPSITPNSRFPYPGMVHFNIRKANDSSPPKSN